MNPMDLLKNFQNIQSRFQEMQEKMKTVTVTGTAGGDMVKVEINGQMQVTNISIAPEVVDPNDVSMLEDLVLAAFTNASEKMREKLREEMSALTGGMDIPPGLMGM
jgi:DNA-binding YbaB/EbfC family protein